jgi:hypothetical protein
MAFNFTFLTTAKFDAVTAFALLDPPSWTRLEPQSTTGDPRPGIEARVHDPLWMIGRQWQLGELAGEDAGTPLTVRVVTETAMVDRWAAGDAEAAGATRPLDHEHQDLLEPWVEREPVAADGRGPGLRARAEAGAALLAALDDAGVAAGHRDAFATHCALDVDALDHPGGEHAALDPVWVRLTRLLAGRGMVDGELAATAFEATAPDPPPWLEPDDDADRAAVLSVVEEWRAWYRADVSPPAGGEDAWVGERLEHRFRIGAGDRVLDAPAHGGGDLDWHTFDASTAPLADPEEGPVAGGAVRSVHALLASPLRYPGMPADRLWEMEDAQVNLGVVEAEPWDLARLLVAEFALTYGNDWLVVPIDIPFGSLTTIESVVYTTTFGERFVVRPTALVSPDERWRMFTITEAGGAAADGLLVPPGAVAVQDGPAIEDVLFLRDEMANLCWAVERSVQGPSGTARDRAREDDDPRPLGPGPVPSAQLDYLLQTGMPARWIPYLPRSSGYRAVELVQGAMPDAGGDPIPPLGRLLATSGLDVLKDAEIPREGVSIRRVPSTTRRADGTHLRWTTRRVTTGRGEGSSRLAFDEATPRGPKAGS